MKIFNIKDLSGKELGKITYLSEEKKFKIDFFSNDEAEKMTLLLEEYLSQGIKLIGDIYLNEPIKPDNPLFLPSAEEQLSRMGYMVTYEKFDN